MTIVAAGMHDAFGATGVGLTGLFFDRKGIDISAEGDGGEIRRGGGCGREVSDDLMTVEIKVHPVWAGPALFTAEQIKIERSCGGEVVSREG